MGFSVNTNIDALNTYANLTKVQNSLSNSLAKLSSGLRINNAGDDAAGMTISTALGAQVSGLNQASRNAQDGNSVVQTADGALSQAQALLQRLRDLAVQAANDSNSSSARGAISTEATSITAELTRLGSSVDFNGIKLLNGTAGAASNGVLTFQVGASNDSSSQITVDLSTANLSTTATALSTSGAGKYYATSTFTASGTPKAYFKSTSGATTTEVAVDLAADGIGTTSTAAQVASALNSDTAFAGKFTASTTVVSSTTYVVISAKDGGTVSSTVADTAAHASDGSVAASSGTTFAGGMNFTTSAGAVAALATIDQQITNVSTARANIGAAENRFASAISTIATSVTNLTAAKSRITDVDMASEMVSYSRANILSQSGTAMLAQANSLPQLALKLLQG